MSAIFSVKRAADDILHLAIADRFRLADQQWQFWRKLPPLLDNIGYGFGQVIKVDKGLAGTQHTRVKMRG